MSKSWREQSAINGYVTLAHLKQSQGDDHLADQMLKKARSLAAQTTVTKSDDRFVATQQAHLWVRRGDLAAAGRWATEQGLDEYPHLEALPTTGQIGADLLRRLELIVFARLLIAQKRTAEASRLLDLLLRSMEQTGSLEKILEIHILQAIVSFNQGFVDRAISSLTTAVNLASPEGHLRPFLNEGPKLISLLEKISTRDGEAEFVQKLLGALSDSRPVIERPEMIEPLSERELQMLRLLETELTVPEIAEELVIAVSTARSHIKSIYAKLGAHSRYEAVSKARDIDLL